MRFSLLAMADVTLGPVASSIKKKIEQSLNPTFLKLVNDSHKHTSHYKSDAGSQVGESHFRLEVVSDIFKGLNGVKRHQLVYTLLNDEFKGGLHALSMKLYTVDEKKNNAK
uniref:Bola-like protein n=1 Tax=Polytomella parva TaxID=51329 RepID=A0A7S0YAG8_9CHLO|mmetsp:Transcript_17992/g.32857  ORF Transcript_17992/g.32857 Transcript_17992/m.32857 type:complete len:111 (+) Transcript_17992:105-437(+)